MTHSLATLAILAVSTAATAADVKGTKVALVGADAVHTASLVVEIDGRSVDDHWTGIFAKLFAFFDRDSNGSISSTESSRILPASALRQSAAGLFIRVAGGGPAWKDLDADRDGKVSPQEFEAYYRARGCGGLLFTSACSPVAPAVSASLAKVLDVDQNGSLSESEIATAQKTLARLDANEDEVVSAAEIVAGIRYPGIAPASVMIPSEKPMLATREGKAPFRLQPLTGKASSEDSVLVFRLGYRPTAKLMEGSGPVWTAVSPMIRFDPTLRAAEQLSKARKAMSQAFAEADGDADGKLTRTEIGKPGALALKSLEPFVGRNGDGSFSRTEVDEWFDLQKQIVAGVVVVGILELGNGLFGFLDADSDGVLSVRELRSAAGRAKSAGLLRDGNMDLTRLPTQTIVTLARGQVLSELVLPHRVGPGWFTAMDSNRDGDVSRTEFPGSPAAFKQLDLDGDGLICPDEVKLRR